MKRAKTTTLSLAVLAALAATQAQAASPGIGAIEKLGLLNGTALACRDTGIVEQAKALMLKHAPRTAEYGTTFEQATQKGYMDQVKNQAVCPAPGALAQRLEAVGAEVREALPPQ